MWMPGPEVSLEPGAEGGVLHFPVEVEKLRVPGANAEPDDPRCAFRRESADALKREEERGETERCEAFLKRSLLR